MTQENNNEKESLDLHDLLVDEKADVLSEYLSLSVENMGENTKVSVTTVEANPTTYSSTLIGVSCNDLHSLLEVNTDPIIE